MRTSIKISIAIVCVAVFSALLITINIMSNSSVEPVSYETPAKVEPLGVTSANKPAHLTESSSESSASHDNTASPAVQQANILAVQTATDNNSSSTTTLATATVSKSSQQETAEQSSRLSAKAAEYQKIMTSLTVQKETSAAETQAAAEAHQAELEALKIHQEQHPELFGGNSDNLAYNSYPWQNECPDKQDRYISIWDNNIIGGYLCECVSYVGWKAYETFGVVVAWGQAYNWGWRAENAGYRVDNEPAENTIGQIGSTPYGHVFWVESVNDDGSINVTEYNNTFSTYLYSGSYHTGDFGARTIPVYEVKNYNYIHLD